MKDRNVHIMHAAWKARVNAVEMHSEDCYAPKLTHSSGRINHWPFNGCVLWVREGNIFAIYIRLLFLSWYLSPEFIKVDFCLLLQLPLPLLLLLLLLYIGGEHRGSNLDEEPFRGGRGQVQRVLPVHREGVWYPSGQGKGVLPLPIVLHGNIVQLSVEIRC